MSNSEACLGIHELMKLGNMEIGFLRNKLHNNHLYDNFNAEMNVDQDNFYHRDS